MCNLSFSNEQNHPSGYISNILITTTFLKNIISDRACKLPIVVSASQISDGMQRTSRDDSSEFVGGIVRGEEVAR